MQRGNESRVQEKRPVFIGDSERKALGNGNEFWQVEFRAKKAKGARGSVTAKLRQAGQGSMLFKG